MACFHPLKAWQSKSALSDGRLTFKEPSDRDTHYPLMVPCGQCIGCRLERLRQWAMRCMHESQMHEDSCFVTLTYSEENIPDGGTLVYRHFQLFMKRLRKLYPQIRFYMCGEYGETFKRPHYHACLFGVRFEDRELYKVSSSGYRLYTSKLLDKLWKKGLCSIGDVTFESAAYVARYVMKKVNGDLADEHYQRFNVYTGEIFHVEPEFANMSRGGRYGPGGIGKTWFDRFNRDIYPQDFVVVNGKKVKPPKYYDRLYSELDAESCDYVGFLRGERAMEFRENSTPERLDAREVVTRARLSVKGRSLE